MHIEFISFFCFYHVVRLMPVKLLYGLAKFLFATLYYIDSKHRNRSIQHLLHAGVAKDLQEAKRIAFASFKHGARLLTELIKMDKNFSLDNIMLSGNKEAEKLLLRSGKDNMPVIIVTGHYGNWEISGKVWTAFSDLNLLTVVRALDNPLIGEYISKIRAADKHATIPKNNSVKYLLKALRSHSSVAILADQHASTREGVETIFFGQPARTHASVAALHLKTGVPIAPMVLRCKDKLFHYEADLAELIQYKATGDKAKDIATVTQMFTSALEKLIAKQPEQWLWAHRRWLNINRKRRNPKH